MKKLPRKAIFAGENECELVDVLNEVIDENAKLKEAILKLSECVDILEYPLTKNNPRVIKRFDLIDKILNS